MVENPPQSELRHAYPFGNQPANFIDSIKRSFEIDARERLAENEFLYFSVETSGYVRGKCGMARDFPGKETARERKPNKDADVTLLCEREKQFFGSLPKNIENDLHGGDPREVGCFQGLLHLFHTDAVVLNFACPF